MRQETFLHCEPSGSSAINGNLHGRLPSISHPAVSHSFNLTLSATSLPPKALDQCRDCRGRGGVLKCDGSFTSRRREAKKNEEIESLNLPSVLTLATFCASTNVPVCALSSSSSSGPRS